MRLHRVVSLVRSRVGKAVEEIASLFWAELRVLWPMDVAAELLFPAARRTWIAVFLRAARDCQPCPCRSVMARLRLQAASTRATVSFVSRSRDRRSDFLPKRSPPCRGHRHDGVGGYRPDNVMEAKADCSGFSSTTSIIFGQVAAGMSDEGYGSSSSWHYAVGNTMHSKTSAPTPSSIPTAVPYSSSRANRPMGGGRWTRMFASTGGSQPSGCGQVVALGRRNLRAAF